MRIRRSPVAGLLLLAGLLLVPSACSDDPVASGADAAGDAQTADGSGDVSVVPPKPLALQSITPSRSGLQGGDQIDLAGTGFGPEAKVFFGQAEAEVAWRAGTSHLYVVAPPALGPGLVDVRVVNGKGAEVVKPKAFAYLEDVTITSFEPAQGPMTGGTTLTVRGSGFHPGDRVLVGYAEALATQVLDENTLVALVPPATVAPEVDLQSVPVSVRHTTGVLHASGTFQYGRAPRLDSVDPPVVGLGGGPVTLKGRALGNGSQLYAGGALAVLVPGTASSARGASLPPLKAVDPGALPGPKDLLLASPFGASKLSPGFAYVDPQDSQPHLWGVLPPSGTTAGGNPATLIASVPGGAQVTGVLFDGKAAKFQATGTFVSAEPPAHAAGPVTVELQTTAGNATLPAGYTYFLPLELKKVVPDGGPPTGGTKISLNGKGFSMDCKVRIGVHQAQIESVSQDGVTLQAITPPGPLGSVDVTVLCGTQEAVLPHGFAYSDGKPHIDAVVPGSGATGGGTTVKVYGAGFKKGTAFSFGGKPAIAVTIVHSGLAELQTPPGEPGVVDVAVTYGDQVDLLVDGFSYYSPQSPNGGTWGTGAIGSLNVAVLNIYSLQPIEGATVWLGQPNDAMYDKHQGLTDAKGQVVFSGPEIVAPVAVSASKAGFTASSIVHFDAANATLLLFPYSPPSSGNPGPPPTAYQAVLRGKVLDVDKYLQVPPTNCTKSSELGDKTCDTCQADADCGSGATTGKVFRCVDNGSAGKRCLADCTTQDVCGKSFACFGEPTLPGVKVCKPSLGIRKVFCATSIRDIDDQNPPPGKAPDTTALPWATVPVDENSGAFEINSRLDELAIQCIGGYISNTSKKFVPTAMGLRRHVFPKPKISPADILEGLDVRLDIALRRNLAVRLDHPQGVFKGLSGELEVEAWLELGADGVVMLPSKASSPGVADDVELPYQPVTLPKDMTDTTYAYRATVRFGGNDVLGPITETLHDDVPQPGDANLRVRNPDGTTTDEAIGTGLELTAAIAGSDDKLLLVGRDGGLWRGWLEKLSLVWLPPVLDPYAQPAVVLAAAGTPTDATIVGEAGLIRRLQGSVVTEEQGALDKTLRGVCHGPLGRVAVGDAGAIQVHRGTVWQAVTAPGVGTLRAVACTPTGAVAVGDAGKVVRLELGGETVQAKVETVTTALLLTVQAAADGTIWVGGEVVAGEGPVLLKDSGNGTWKSGWPAGTVLPKLQGLRALVPGPAASLLLVDREGGLYRLDAAGLHDESPERRDLRPTTGVLLSDGRAVLAGQPGLWLGPFLTVPDVVAPTTVGKAGALPCEWTVAPGPSPSFTRVHIESKEGFPFWWIYVGPEITSMGLPDFKSKGINVLPTNFADIEYRIRVDRGYVPGFSIDGFDTFDLEFGRWRSRASNYRDLQSQ